MVGIKSDSKLKPQQTSNPNNSTPVRRSNGFSPELACMVDENNLVQVRVQRHGDKGCAVKVAWKHHFKVTVTVLLRVLGLDG